MQHKRGLGEYTGGLPPYGWRVGSGGVRLVVHPAEQRIIGAAHRMHAGGLSLRTIGARLAQEGLLPRSGGRWHAKTVADLLTARAA